MKIINVWEGRTSTNQNLTLLIQHFTQFLALDDMKIEENPQEEKNWQIVSNYSQYLKGLLSIIKSYQEQGKITEIILAAFCTVMQKNIVLLEVHRQHYIYAVSNGERPPTISLGPHFCLSLKIDEDKC